MPHRGLGTDNHSPLRGIVGFSSKPQLPKNPGPGSLLALPSMFIVLDEELCSFSTHQRLGESSKGSGSRLFLALPSMFMVIGPFQGLRESLGSVWVPTSFYNSFVSYCLIFRVKFICHV